MSVATSNRVDVFDCRWASLFAPEKVQVDTLGTQRHIINVQGGITDTDKSYNFEIPSFGDQFLDLNSFEIYVSGEMVPAVTKTTKAVVTNNFLDSLFENVSVYLGLNQVEITDGNMFHFKNFIKRLTTEEPDLAKQRCYGLNVDVYGKKGNGDSIKAWQASRRMQWFNQPNRTEFYGKLNMDFLDTPGPLLPGTPMIIRLRRSPDDFYMIQDETETAPYRFNIKQIYLSIVSFKAEPALTYEIERMVKEEQPASYKWNQHYVKQFALQTNSYKITTPTVFRGILPRKLCVAFINQEALLGNRYKNPYNLQHLNVKSMRLSHNGAEIKRLEQDFSENYYLETYRSFLNWSGGTNNMIKMENFPIAHVLYCFDLLEGCEEPSTCEELFKTGTLTLDISLKEKISEPMIMVVIGIVPVELSIDHKRGVTLHNELLAQ